MDKFPVNKDLGESGNRSEAHNSEIKTPDEDLEQLERTKKTLGISAMEEKLEEQHNSLNIITTQLESVSQAINKIVLTMNEKIGSNVEAPKDNITSKVVDATTPEGLSRLATLGDTAESLAKAYAIATGKGTGGGTPGGEFQVDLMKTIFGSFSKLISIQVDDALMKTYNTKLPPPSWAFNQTPPPPKPPGKIEFE